MNKSTGSRSPARTRLGLAVLICAALVAGAGAGSAAPMASSPVASALDDVPEARAATLSLAESDPTYAGVSTASSTDGAPAVTFYFAGRDTNRDAEVLSLLPPDLRSNARIVVVEHSLVDLTDSKDRVFARVSRESAIQGVGIDIERNGLFVLTGDADPSRALGELSLIDSSIPVRLMTGENTIEACSNRDNCGGTSSRRGGVRVTANGSSGTSGLSVVRNADGLRYSTTAGHLQPSSSSATVTSGTESYGALNSYKYYFSGSFCDCRLITSSYVANRLYYSDANPFQAITSKRTNSATGDTVRLSGIKTQGNGTVQVIDYDYYDSACGCSMKAATLATYASQTGDSGGAVTSTGGGVAVGMHSGRSGTYARYFDVDNIQGQMGVTVLITP